MMLTHKGIPGQTAHPVPVSSSVQGTNIFVTLSKYQMESASPEQIFERSVAAMSAVESLNGWDTMFMAGHKWNPHGDDKVGVLVGVGTGVSV